MDILIYRDPRESRRKCSLTPLRDREDLCFVHYKRGRRLDAGKRILLHPEGDELSRADRGADLLLIDCSWRHLPALLASVDGELTPRRLPPLESAYPRKSKVFEDPASGLASVEALYAAVRILDEPRIGLLDGYHWRPDFLALNPGLGR
jgi:pre-rRNA-processing protein TSR3